MVDQTVANLKITVDSTDLTKVNDQLAATGAATDAFNSKLSGTANAAQPARTATQGLANDLNAMAGQTTAASGSFGTLLASIQGFGSGLKNSLFNLQTWRDTWAQMTPVAKNATEAVAKHAVETRAASEATHVMVEALHGVRPALAELGQSMGSTRELTMLLHGGFLLLAAALGGGIIASMAKLNDELDESSKKIQAFTGNAHDTKEAMETFGQLAKESGVGVTDFADALAKLMQNGPQVATVVNSLGYSMGRTASASDAYIATLKGITDAMTKMGASTDVTSKVLADFASSVDKDGTVAKGFWKKLGDDAPIVAQNLAAALGFTKNSMQSATQVMTQFGEQGLISFTQLTAGMQKLSSFTQEGEQSISMAWGRIKQAWNGLVEALGSSPFIKSAMKEIADAIDRITDSMKHGATLWESVTKEWTTNWKKAMVDDIVPSAQKAFDAVLDYVVVNIVPGIIKAFINAFTPDFITKSWVGQTTPAQALNQLNSSVGNAEQASATGGAVGNLDTQIKDVGVDSNAAAKATDQLGASLNTQKTATDDLSRSAQSVGGAMDPLNAGLKDTATSAQTAAPAVTSLSGALSGLVSAIQNAVSAIGNAESSASAGATGDVVQLPPSAEGNLFQISAGGGKDSIRMTGMVSPDEIVAIIPKENASAGLLTHIQAAIGNSPISISPDGQSGTSVSAIAAPSSYAAYEAMSRNGSPALASGGHFASAVPSPGSAGAVANATAASTARAASNAGPATVAVTGPGGQQYNLSPDEAALYNEQQAALAGPAFTDANGIQWYRTKWGGYLPNSTVNIGHGPSDADFSHMGGFTYNDTGGGSASSAASSVSRVASAAQASQAAANAAGITDDQIRKDLEAKLTGAGTVADQMSRNAASLPAAPIAQPVQGPNLPSTVMAPESRTIDYGIPLPPEAPGYNPPTEQDQLAAMYQEMGYNSDTGLDFGDTSASSNVYSADQGYTGIPESYTGSMGAENMGDFGASLGDPGTADLSYDTGSDYTAGDFATGGGFTVPFGSNGADSVRIRLNASGGERIRVDRPGEPEDSRIGGATKGRRDSSGDNHFHFYGVTDAASFQASRTALMRFAQQAASS